MRKSRAPNSPQAALRPDIWRDGARGVLCRSLRSVSTSSTALRAFLINPSSPACRTPQATRISKFLVARVEARLREHPEEGEGWEVIAPVYMGWGRYADAAEAYRQSIRLLGESAKRLANYGQGARARQQWRGLGGCAQGARAGGRARPQISSSHVSC